MAGSTKHILYLCGGRSFFVARLGRKLKEVADCWRRSGYKVTHVCGGDVVSRRVDSAGEGGYHAQRASRLMLSRVPGVHALVMSLSELRDVRHDKLTLEYLGAIGWNQRPDIVWERSCRLHCAGLSFARQLGVPYVLEWKDHLVDYRFSLLHGRAIRMEAHKNDAADYVVVESEVLRGELQRQGVDVSKVIVAHNAVRAAEFGRDEGQRARMRRLLGVTADTVLVGYLGSYAFYHDASRLVLAADIICRRKSPQKVKILMMGSGKEYSECRALAANRGLLGDVLIMRPGVSKEEVPEALAALDIAVLPGSTDIICPIKIQEYMASELPSVAPDYPCNREVLCDRETGVLFRPKDENALAEALLTLARDQALRRRMGRHAREVVAERFSWEATWGAALDSVLKREEANPIGNCRKGVIAR